MRGQAQLVNRNELSRGVDPALQFVRALQRAALGGDEAKHHHLSLRHEAQRLEAARPLIVVLQEEAVHVQLAEQCLGDEVVAALGRPGRAEVTPAHVRGHGHVRGPACDGVVDLADISQVQVLGVLAALGDLGTLGLGRSGKPGWCRRAGGSGSRVRPGAEPHRRMRPARSDQNSSMSGYTSWSIEAGPPR